MALKRRGAERPRSSHSTISKGSGKHVPRAVFSGTPAPRCREICPAARGAFEHGSERAGKRRKGCHSLSACWMLEQRHTLYGTRRSPKVKDLSWSNASRKAPKGLSLRNWTDPKFRSAVPHQGPIVSRLSQARQAFSLPVRYGHVVFPVSERTLVNPQLF